MAATIPHEIEVKLRLNSLDAFFHAGIVLEMESARHFEDNWLLDFPGQFLGARGAILRVRFAAGKGSITYKERVAEERHPSQFKKRLEIETPVDDPASALAIFERLGYRKWFRYQKYRTIYRALLPPPPDQQCSLTLHLMVDETPVGDFVELEGEEEAIARAVDLIGVTPADYILESYLAIQAEHCRQQGKPFEDMIFVEK
jgi:adenylate cyclase class 2